MSKLLFNTKYEFWLLKGRMNILQITIILVVSTGFGDDKFGGGGGGGGGMVVASMYPASRIVVKPISCEHTSIFVDNILLLERWDMISANVVWY